MNTSNITNYKPKDFAGLSDVKMYFAKTDSKTVIQCERHRIKNTYPLLGEIKRKGIYFYKSKQLY